MSESTIGAILVLLLIGQAIAAYRGRLSGVLYYCAVGPLGYFSVWHYATWDPQRLCGAVLLAAEATRLRAANSVRVPPAFVALAFWGCLVTLFGATVKPARAMTGASPVYGTLQPFVKIAEWLITIGVGYTLASVLLDVRARAKLCRVVMVAGAALALYGIYQTYADRVGLPATGIRVPIWNATSYVGEQFSRVQIRGFTVLRACSFAGEPKGLGGLCVFWLSLIWAQLLLRTAKLRGIIGAATVVVLVTLALTLSTAAWGGAAVSALLLFACSHRLDFTRASMIVVSFLLACGVFLTGAGSTDVIADISRQRTVERFEGKGVLGESIEQATLELFSEQPWLAVFGCGLGGIGPRLAEKFNFPGGLVFPDNGLVNWICNTGLVGLILLALSFGRTVTLLWGARRCVSSEAVAVAFVGLNVLAQCLIFGSPYLQSIAFGFLLAADHLGRRDACVQRVPQKYAVRARLGEQSAASRCSE